MGRPKDNRWRRKPPIHPGIRNRERRDTAGIYWVFEVRWTDPATHKKLSETLDTPQDALDFKAQLRALRRRGILGDLDRGRETLDDFAGDWLERHASTHLTPKVLSTYASAYDREISPRMGAMELRQIKPRTVDNLRSSMLAAGAKPPTVIKTLTVLSSMLERAVLWERIDVNPVHSVKKPPAKRTKVIHALSVIEVERILHHLRIMGDEDGATLVELMAYTGARPQDALALAYTEVGETIHYAFKVVDGNRVPGAKTGPGRSRTVKALPIVLSDLRHRQLTTVGARRESLVLDNDGRPWAAHTYKNWTRKVARGKTRTDGTRAGQPGPFPRAVAAAGLPPDITPYTLRHSYASLRIAEGKLSLQEIAEEMGHDLAVLAETYAHVISDYAGKGRVDPDTLIRQARDTIAAEHTGRQTDAKTTNGQAS